MSWILEESIYNIDRKCWQNIIHEFETKEAAEEFGVNNFLSGITKHYEVYHS